MYLLNMFLLVSFHVSSSSAEFYELLKILRVTLTTEWCRRLVYKVIEEN